jgi:hypothetical protein
MPDFFFHSATRCATRATFQYQAKGDSFLKKQRTAVRKLFAS